MKSILIIGVGRFGRHLARTFAELGDEVMIVDRDEEKVNALADVVTSAQIGDCTDERVLDSLGVNNFDLCFVCISDDFQSSLEVTSLLKEKGAQRVVSKVDRDIHAKFLLRNGADEVVYPERDMALRTAMRLSARNAFDYIAMGEDYAIFEVQTPESWVGKTIGEVAVRTRYNLNVIAAKRGNRIMPLTSAEHRFNAEEHLILSGSKKDFERFDH